jgi:hypothetical protein
LARVRRRTPQFMKVPYPAGLSQSLNKPTVLLLWPFYLVAGALPVTNKH